jgi:hypothetical protein
LPVRIELTTLWDVSTELVETLNKQFAQLCSTHRCKKQSESGTEKDTSKKAVHILILSSYFI